MASKDEKAARLEAVAETLYDSDDASRRLEPEEELIVEAADLPAGDESVVAGEEISWEPTHAIGDYTVQERSFVNGLKYWIEENGKRRRPTKANPLRKFAPKPEATKQVWLDKQAMSILMSAYFSDFSEYMEDAFGNVAQRVDDQHVILSLYDKHIQSHHRYLIQIPEEFEVIGAKIP